MYCTTCRALDIDRFLRLPTFRTNLTFDFSAFWFCLVDINSKLLKSAKELPNNAFPEIELLVVSPIF